MHIFRTVHSRWVNGREASCKLGFSENSLKCWRDCGYLKLGKHWQLNNYTKSDRILYNIEQCTLEMNEWWGRDAINGP